MHVPFTQARPSLQLRLWLHAAPTAPRLPLASDPVDAPAGACGTQATAPKSAEVTARMRSRSKEEESTRLIVGSYAHSCEDAAGQVVPDWFSKIGQAQWSGHPSP